MQLGFTYSKKRCKAAFPQRESQDGKAQVSDCGRQKAVQHTERKPSQPSSLHTSGATFALHPTLQIAAKQHLYGSNNKGGIDHYPVMCLLCGCIGW